MAADLFTQSAARAPTERMILTGAQALHDDWRKAFLPGGKWADYQPAIKRECLFAWDNLHPENRTYYLNSSRVILTAALAVRD